MDKNFKQFKQKTKDFFKREGFFVVLFVCLCVVTMLGAVTIKKAKVQQAPEVVEKPTEQIVNNTKEEPKKVSTPGGNAEQVNKNNKTEADNKTVASTTVKFTNPVEGKIACAFNEPTMTDDGSRFISGINIESKVGTDVKAGADGVVYKIIDAKSSEFKNASGVVIEIKHANGLITKYCNLDNNILVKKDQKVTSTTVIGKVGNTATSLVKEGFGEFLNLQVWNGKEEVDPTKYFTTYKLNK